MTDIINPQSDVPIKRRDGLPVEWVHHVDYLNARGFVYGFRDDCDYRRYARVRSDGRERSDQESGGDLIQEPEREYGIISWGLPLEMALRYERPVYSRPKGCEDMSQWRREP